MAVNPSETKEVAFGRRAVHVSILPDIQVGIQATFLVLDENLTRMPHLNNLSTKLEHINCCRTVHSRRILYFDSEDLPRLNSVHQDNTRQATKYILPNHHFILYEKKTFV